MSSAFEPEPPLLGRTTDGLSESNILRNILLFRELQVGRRSLEGASPMTARTPKRVPRRTFEIARFTKERRRDAGSEFRLTWPIR
jgi:hypothetical protein